MAARGIRDLRQGNHRPGIQPSRGPHLGRPVMTHQPMISPVAPVNLQQPRPPMQSPVSAPAGMPPGLQGPQPVMPQGPANIGPAGPTVAR